jgi:hypothetical protein
MLKTLLILSGFLVVFAGCASFFKGSNKDTNTVFVLASLHNGMFANPNCSMLDFQRAIITYRPTGLILI